MREIQQWAELYSEAGSVNVGKKSIIFPFFYFPFNCERTIEREGIMDEGNVERKSGIVSYAG